MKKIITTLLSLASVTGLSLSGQTTINVPGFSFENPPLAPGTNGFTGTTDPAWTVVEFNSNAVGSITDANVNLNTPPPNGTIALYFTNRDSNAANPTRVYQEIFDGVSTQTQANTDYTLTVSMIDINLGSSTPSFEIGLFEDAAMTTALATRDQSTITLIDSVWTDFSVTWNAGASDGGKALYIGFSNSQAAGGNTGIGIDNVRLSSIPEPSSAGILVAFSMLFFVFLRRKR